ncbi:multiple sugar transport system substrate-binding protein [Aminobacter lissarensis]|uniref:Multiple sugar transport system substrate-binding protein n=1 Tax=Aminobacter carboxidus TaxID=376165 RepID=A0A8E1WJK0_9HYPH|nr:extracellular solute-binding protein [Aminobacter lissarensis]MBB6469138.1 multiple sugar transport system substrate-binding protein [Aminobacter lissarensis]
MSKFIVSRRKLLQAAALAPALAAPAFVRKANAQSSFDWQKHKGESVDILLVKNPRNEILAADLAEFKELTGINASIELMPEQQYRQKIVIEFASGRPSFDVAELTLTVQKRLAAKGGWFEDLRPIIQDANLTSPDFDFADFSQGGVEAATQADGTLDTLPAALDYFLLYYNKELFEAKNVALPNSMDDLVRAASELNDPNAGVAGFVSRGLKNANVPVWMSLLFGQDVGALDNNGNLLTDTPEAVWAAKLFTTLNKDYGPPGVVGFNWNECQTTFSQGFAAMWLDSTAWARPLEDPKKSKIAGKIGYMPVPKGPKAQASAVFASGVGIAKGSTRKGPAWYYLQWAYNKQNQIKLLQSGAGSPARKSSFQDPQVVSSATLPKAYFDTLLDLMDIGRSSLPDIIPVTEFRDIFGIALANMLTGSEPEAELKAATATFKPILESSER